MRLLHTSDTHLGHQQFPRIDPTSGLNQREMDHMAAWQAIIDHAVETRPDVFVHAGDLFDGVRPSNRALAAALDGFRRLSDAGIEAIVIAGNHDHPKLRATGSPLRLLEHLPHVHPVYKGHAEAIVLGDRTFHAVPQCADAATLRDEVAKGTGGARDVLVLHGAVMDLPAFHHAEFNEQTLDRAWFDGYGYVALGHYHGLTEVAPNAWYCGAPERVSMAEAGEDKGFIEVDLDAGTTVFQSLETRPYRDLHPIDGTGMSTKDIEAHVATAIARIPEGAVARQKVTGVGEDLRGALDLRALRQQAAHALHFDLVVEWESQGGRVGGGVELGGLRDEFEAFAKQQTFEGRDRDVLVRMALDVLEEAT